MPLTRDAFEASIRTHGALLRHWLRVRTARNEDADELLQRTFECAWRKREIYRGNALLPWLFGIARNELKYHRRGNTRVILLESDLLARLVDQELDAYDPERLASYLEMLDRLQHCIEQLDPLSRRMIQLFHGLEALEPGSEAIPSPFTPSDAEVAARLSADSGRAWTPGSVKMRRHRGYESLRQCYEASNLEPRLPIAPGSEPFDSDAAEQAERKETGMRKAPRQPDPHPSYYHLLELLEQPDAPDLAAIRRHAGGCLSCRSQVAGLQAIETALASRAWQRAVEASSAQSPAPLPEATLDRLLAIVEARDETILETRADAISRGPAGDSIRRHPAFVSNWRSMALAATLLLALAVWQWPRRLEPEEAPAARLDGQLRGQPPGTPEEPFTASQPVTVVIRRADARDTELSTLQLVGPGHWQAGVPSDALLQLRVNQPDTPGVWTASVSCVLSGRPVYLHPDGTTTWTGQGNPGTPGLAVGRPLRLEALNASPDAHIQCHIQRNDEHFQLDLVIAP